MGAGGMPDFAQMLASLPAGMVCVFLPRPATELAVAAQAGLVAHRAGGHIRTGTTAIRRFYSRSPRAVTRAMAAALIAFGSKTLQDTVSSVRRRA